MESRKTAAMPRRRRWIQFRLRAALAVLIVCSLLFAAARWRLDAYRQQRESLEEVTPMAVYVATIAGWPKVLRPFVDSQSFADVTHLSFHNQYQFNDSTAFHLARFPHLKRLSLHGTAITDNGLKRLGQLRELDTLSLKSTQISDNGVRHLAGIRSLRQLQLSGPKVTRHVLEHLAKMKNLEILEISNVQLLDEDIARLARFPKLSNLSFSPGKLTEKGFNHLSAIKTLEAVALEFPVGNHVQIRSLPRLSKLTIDAAGFQYQDPVSLTLVDLSNLKTFSLNVRRLDALELRGLSNLQELDLKAMTLKSGVISELRHVPKLHSLWLSDSRFPPAELASLAELRHLTVLDLCHVSLKDTDLQHLSGLVQLTQLRLANNPIYGHGLRHLVPLKNLMSLDISETRIDRHPLARSGSSRDLLHDPFFGEVFDPAAAFDAILKMKSLQSLNLSGLDVSKDQLIAIGKELNLSQLGVDTLSLSDEEYAELTKVLPLVAPKSRFMVRGIVEW